MASAHAPAGVGGHGSPEGMRSDDGGAGAEEGLLISACRRHHLPPAPPNAPPGNTKKRRRLDAGCGGGAADAARASGGGPFRVLLTTSDQPNERADPTRIFASSTGSSSSSSSSSGGGGSGSRRLLASVAMDLAHALASNSPPPRCRGCGRGDNAANEEEQSQQQCCRCVDVVYLLPDSASPTTTEEGGDAEEEEEEEEELLLGSDLFPLRCRQMVGSDNDNGGDDDQEGTASSNTTEEAASPQPTWDEAALSRVEIRRVRSAADLVRYLATVSLLPPHRRPVGGIVIHDLGAVVLGNCGNDGGQGEVAKSGGPSSSSSSSLGPSYYTIDSSIVLTQILSLLGNTADYLERQRRQFVPPPSSSSAQTTASPDADEQRFALLVTMDGAAYSQLPPHTKPVLQNWLPVLGTLRPASAKESKDGSSSSSSDGWALDLKRDGWRLPLTALDGPMTYGGAAGCSIKQRPESVDGMPEILWNVK